MVSVQAVCKTAPERGMVQFHTHPPRSHSDNGSTALWYGASISSILIGSTMKFSETRKVKVWKLPVNYEKLTGAERREIRNQYVREQKNYCPFCKQELSRKPVTNYSLDLGLFPKGFLDNPIHLHHDHNTGLTLGAYHAYCNGVLWQYFGE